MKPNTRLLSRRPQLRRLSREAVNPDGVPIVVEWDQMAVGTSVFIPAINHEKLKVQMSRQAADRGMRLEGRSRIEGGKYGMRFWRTL